MQLNLQTWYVQWFFWSLRVLDRFCKTANGRRNFSSEEKYYHGTNICHFFRTLLLGNLIAAVTLATYGLLLWAIILPFLLFPLVSVGKTVLIVLAMLTTVALTMFIIIGGARGVNHVIQRLNTRPVNTQPGFWKLLIHYIVSIKQQFCPIIQFRGDSPDA